MPKSFLKATKTRAKARIAIDGPSGSGKTYTALIAARALAGEGHIALIDTERGSASLYSDLFDFDVAPLEDYHPDNYIKLIDEAEAAGYTVIVIDSLSHAWEGSGGILDLQDDAQARQKTKNSFTAWKDVTPIHRRFVDRMLQSKCHIIATMRAKMEYVQEPDGKGRTTIRKVGMAPIQRAGMEYEFTVVADIDVEHTLTVSKSRYAPFADAVAKKPGVDFWQPFADWLNTGAEPAMQPPAPSTVPPADRPKHDNKVLAKIALALEEKGLAQRNNDNTLTIPIEHLRGLLRDPRIKSIHECSPEQLAFLAKVVPTKSTEQLQNDIMEAL